MGECSVYGSLHADSEVKPAAWAMSWWSSGIDWRSLKWLEWTPAYGFAADDRTIHCVSEKREPFLFLL